MPCASVVPVSGVRVPAAADVERDLGADDHRARGIDDLAADDARAGLSGRRLRGEQEENLGGDDQPPPTATGS